MSDTKTTAQAARQAGVTIATVRTWCRIGAVAATKVSGRWNIDPDSLAHRIALPALLRAEVIDLSAFRDAKTARTKATDLVEQAAIIPASRPNLYLAAASDGTDTYLIDTAEGSCTCKGYVHQGRCYHLVAAVLLEARPATQFATAA